MLGIAYRLYRYVGWGVIGLAACLTLFNCIMPILISKPKLTMWLNAQSPYPIKIEALAISIKGLKPTVTLSGVEFLAPNSQQTILSVDKLTLRLNTTHCLLGDFDLDTIIITGASIGIEYQQDGKFSFSQLPEISLDPRTFLSENRWPTLQRVIMEDSDIHFMLGEGRSLPITHARLWFDHASHISVQGGATVIGLNPAFIDFQAELSLNEQLNGQRFYVHWYGGQLADYANFLPSTFPIIFDHGRVDAKVWVERQQNNKSSVRSDFHFYDLAAHNKSTGEKVAFENLQGKIQANEQEKTWDIFGINWQMDHEQPFDFTIGQVTCENETCWELKAHHLNVEKWIQGLALLDLPDSWHKIKQMKPRGMVNYLHLVFNQAQAYQPIQANLTFSDLTIDEGKSHPALTSLHGEMSFAQMEGKLHLTSEKMQLQFSPYWDHGLPITEFDAQIDWQQKGHSCFLWGTTSGNFDDIPIEGNIAATFEPGMLYPDIEILLHADSFTSTKALSVLPRKVLDNDLIAWLDSAILTGILTNTTAVIRGNLADFPFDERQGVFEVQTDLMNVNLDYATPWPALTQLQATLQFKNRSLILSAEKANLEGGILLSAQATIADLSADLPRLRVDAEIKSTLEEGIKVIHQSPLKESLAKSLAPFTLAGNMNLSLGLEIPMSLQTADPVVVRGLIEVDNAKVENAANNLAIQALQGKVSFTQDSIQSDKLEGIFFNHPANFQINSELTANEPQLHILAQGKIAIDSLLDCLKIDEIKSIGGETDYAVQWITSPGTTTQSQLTVSSTLTGIHIDAPLPFGKKANTARPSQLTFHIEPNDLIRIAIKYGDESNSAFSFNRQDKSWNPIGGHIHLGEKRLAKFREDGILLVDGEIEELDFSTWENFLNEVVPKDSLASSLDPKLNLDMVKWSLMGMTFGQTNLEAQWKGNDHLWDVSFDGASIKGHVIVPQSHEIKPLIVDLKTLTLPLQNESIQAPIANEAHRWSRYPLDIKISQLKIENKVFNDFFARIEPSDHGYEIVRVKALMKGTTIDLSGHWHYLLPSQSVQATGKLVTQNIEDTLNAFGIEGSLRKAKGTIGFSLQWQGTPAKLDYPTLGGNAEFTLNQGFVHGVNPGIGKVLSLLNLDNVKRRLQLDFSDVTKSGFAFDQLTGKFQFGKGKMSSNKINLNGPSAKIEAFGQTDLQNQSVNGEMIIMPDVTASLPIAAAIAAGNPAVGAAVWVADKILGSKIQQIHRYRYKVQGTWAKPNVQEIPLVAKG